MAKAMQQAFILIAAFFLNAKAALAQTDPETANFLRTVVTQKHFFYSDAITAFELEELKSVLSEKTATRSANTNEIQLTRSERAYILLRAEEQKGFRWKEGTFKEGEAINGDTLNKIFTNPKLGWPYFYKRYGNHFLIFSRPIFLRGNTLCLFYSSNNCGDLCGSGSWGIYKKEKGSWVRKVLLTFWIS